MANESRRKEAPEDLWKGSVEQDYLESEQGILTRALVALRALVLRLSRRRNYPRLTLTFTDPILTKLSFNDQEVDVAPCDIGLGGIGLDIPLWLLGDLKIGQTFNLQLSFDAKKWQETIGEIRYVRSRESARGSVGIEFKNLTPALRQSILEYQKTRPGRI